MGGWKSFHNSGILSSIRYRQLLEEKGLNGEPFCGHQQKIDAGVSKIDSLLVDKAEDTICCNSFI